MPSLSPSWRARRLSAVLLLLLAGLVLPVQAKADAEPGDFFISAYAGRAAKERLLDIVTRFNTGFIDSYMVTVAPGYIIGQGRNIRSDVEVQVTRHWGEQNHWEFNAAYIARWMNFPWDHRLDTRLALGAGVSWATEVPFIEPRAKELGQEESAQFLGYVVIEAEFMPARPSSWSGFIRLHHRSDAWGIFHDNRGGSNFITLGTRYHF